VVVELYKEKVYGEEFVSASLRNIVWSGKIWGGSGEKVIVLVGYGGQLWNRAGIL